MLGATLHLGLPDALRPAAAELYWQAFGGKLGLVLGPWPLARRFLLRVMRPDQVIIALGPDGRLLGIAGFRTAEGGFAAGVPGDLRAVYGLAGAFWRSHLLSWLAGSESSLGSRPGAGFLIDGLCVAPQARGQGLGTALIEALCAEAALRGHRSLRLEVVEQNHRAVVLYQRLGFQIISRQTIGPLRPVFRYGASLTMERDLPRPIA